MGTAAGTSHGSCNTTGRSCWGGWLRASSRTARITRGGKRTACLPRIRCQEGGGTTGCLGRGGWYGAPSRSACLPPRLGEWAPRRHLQISSMSTCRRDDWTLGPWRLVESLRSHRLGAPSSWDWSPRRSNLFLADHVLAVHRFLRILSGWVGRPRRGDGGRLRHRTCGVVIQRPSPRHVVQEGHRLFEGVAS